MISFLKRDVCYIAIYNIKLGKLLLNRNHNKGDKKIVEREVLYRRGVACSNIWVNAQKEFVPDDK